MRSHWNKYITTPHMYRARAEFKEEDYHEAFRWFSKYMTPYLLECVRNFTNIKLIKEINAAEKYSNDEFYRILLVILAMKLNPCRTITDY